MSARGHDNAAMSQSSITRQYCREPGKSPVEREKLSRMVRANKELSQMASFLSNMAELICRISTPVPKQETVSIRES
jgi:methylphosphotriester-DNA--protein-cysteine methyltransferase